jgi:hypothetical protein
MRWAPLVYAAAVLAACSTYGEEQRDRTQSLDENDAGGPGSDGSVLDATVPGTSDGGSEDAATAKPELIADWPFGEGSGTTIGDVSGHAHHGDAKTSTWTADRAGAAGSALLLDGSSSRVVVPSHADFDRPAGARFTMMAWARADGPADHWYLLEVGFGSEGYGLELLSPTQLCYWDGIDHVATGNVTNVGGVWHHYAIVVDGATARTYFDGAKIAEGGASTTPRIATIVEMGHDVVEPDFFKGALDKVRFFRGALTDTQVRDEMNR